MEHIPMDWARLKKGAKYRKVVLLQGVSWNARWMRLCSRDHIWPARALWGHFEVDAEGLFLYFTAHTFSLIPLFFIFRFVLYSPSFYTPKFLWLHVFFFFSALLKVSCEYIVKYFRQCDSIYFTDSWSYCQLFICASYFEENESVCLSLRPKSNRY